MEHYFIYICNESPTSKEHALVLNYINSLLPFPENISHIYSDINSLPILKCTAIYLAVINAQSGEKTVKWMKVATQMNLSHLTFGSKQDSQQSIVEDTNMSSKVGDGAMKENVLEDSNMKDNIDMDQILSTKLNNLADELPASGSFKLDVIISQNVLKELSISKDLEFAGSLYRLFLWHFAHITIVITQEEESNMKEWCDIIDAEVLKDHIDSVLGPVIWRGSMQFKNPDISYPGFQLRLDHFENEIKLDDSAISISDLEAISYEHLTLSPHLHVVDECSFASIPIYLILPIAFRLNICESNTFNEHSKKLLEYFNQNNGAALIVRLQYSILYETPKPDKSLSTSKWQKMISSSNIKFPDNCFPVFEKYLTFAITTSATTGKVVAFPLRDPANLDAKFYFSNLKLMESKSSQHFDLKDTCENNPVALEVPYLPQPSFQTLVNKINLLGLTFKETRCKNRHKSKDVCCLESLLETITKCFPSYSLATEKNDLHIIKEEIDPSDWPERVHLLQKQIQTDNKKKNIPPNVFLNLSPQRAKNTISFACQEAEKYFLPTGEARNGTNVESVPVLANNTKTAKEDFEKLLHLKWPEVLVCKHDDVYYNCGKQTEDKESVGNEMVRFYVQHETASSCNNQQLKTDPSIAIRTKSKPANLKYRTPSTPRSMSRLKKRFSKANINVGASSSKANVLESSSRLKRCAEVKIKGRDKKLPVKRNTLPVRSSPRKKIPVKYSQTNTRNSRENQRRTSDPQQLPEILTKKLRVAVASALEKNGIHLDDAFFRPCGRRLFTICQAFVQDIPRQTGSTSQHMQKIADAHVKQVIEFERQKETGR